MKKKNLLLVSFAILILSSCRYDIEEELYGTNCDTTNVRYSTTITSLLNNYGCLGCHAGTNPSGGINLDSYINVKTKITDGRLFGAINHSPGFHPMPDGGPKMNQCDINKIKAWIDAGAPNN
jgi:hypothetical protein